MKSKTSPKTKVMHNRNVSSPSLNENLYDIALSGGDAGPKKKFVPRRGSLLTSLNNLPEQKRPSEYYLSRMSLGSATSASPKPVTAGLNLGFNLDSTQLLLLETTKSPKTRPVSNTSVSSNDAAKDSDDAALVVLTPFDVPDSRLSSMTNYSTYSTTRPGDSTISVAELPVKLEINTIAEKTLDVDTSADNLSLSLSTITLNNQTISSNESVLDFQAPQLLQYPPTPPKLRAASTSSVLELKRQPTVQQQLPPLARQASASSSFMLTRTKTRYYNPKETKERKQLRKKLYEENDDDDELLTNDLDLVFNVPVIKNHGEIYRTRRTESVPNMILSRNDIVTGDDNKYPYKPTESMKPCPLPGKLSRSNLSLDRIPTAIPELRPLPSDDSILEDDESRHTSFASTENDSEICNNISDFYSQRSLSYSAIARASREQLLSDKLPNFVKTHSSVEDLSLISLEKLEVIDQSRPINLPPKKSTDKAKHHRELHRVITDFEATTRTANNLRVNLGILAIANQQSWLKLMASSDEKDFGRKLNYDREKLRKLNWESVVPGKFRFEYFMKVLLVESGKDFADSMAKTLDILEDKVHGLSQQMKAAKDSEFNSMIEQVLQRPLFKNFLVQLAETQGTEFDTQLFRENFRHLLYLKTFSEGGLLKHHQIFVIPMFLIFFQSTESFADIYTLIELFDREVFNPEVFSSLNKKLSCWSDLSQMSHSSAVYKVLKSFPSLQEFEHLSATTLFELIIQLNDRLPLSLSAPSTPIIAQSPFRTLSKTSSDSEGGAKNGSLTSLDSGMEWESDSFFSASSSLSLAGVFLQLLVIFSRSKNRKQKFASLFQGFLLTIFQYYHINWNSCEELVRDNRSIKLNNSNDQLMNLESFLDKWKVTFKKL